jgi:hypothetical protein
MYGAVTATTTVALRIMKRLPKGQPTSSVEAEAAREKGERGQREMSYRTVGHGRHHPGYPMYGVMRGKTSHALTRHRWI